MFETPYLCDHDCNNCPIIGHKNSKQLTAMLNHAYNVFGDDFYDIVESWCPNMTCCFDCCIDDFCHIEGCKIMKKVNKVDSEKVSFDTYAHVHVYYLLKFVIGLLFIYLLFYLII